jgi:hypothetical protein
MTTKKLARVVAEKISINRSGYDRTGRYWGVGSPLYRVSMRDSDGDEQAFAFVRASNAKQAKAAAEFQWADKARFRRSIGMR